MSRSEKEQRVRQAERTSVSVDGAGAGRVGAAAAEDDDGVAAAAAEDNDDEERSSMEAASAVCT